MVGGGDLDGGLGDPRLAEVGVEERQVASGDALLDQVAAEVVEYLMDLGACRVGVVAAAEEGDHDLPVSDCPEVEEAVVAADDLGLRDLVCQT